MSCSEIAGIELPPCTEQKKYIPTIKQLVACGVPREVARAIKTAVVAGAGFVMTEPTMNENELGVARSYVLVSWEIVHDFNKAIERGKAKRNKRARKRK